MSLLPLLPKYATIITQVRMTLCSTRFTQFVLMTIDVAWEDSHDRRLLDSNCRKGECRHGVLLITALFVVFHSYDTAAR